MLVELDKKSLISLVKGSVPDYSVMDHALIRVNGYFVGGHVDKWEWNSLIDVSEQDLYQIYIICKESWE